MSDSLPPSASVERSLLAMSRPAGLAPPGYGPPPGPPGYPALPYAAPGPLPAHPGFLPQPVPFANPPRPPLQLLPVSCGGGAALVVLF